MLEILVEFLVQLVFEAVLGLLGEMLAEAGITAFEKSSATTTIGAVLRTVLYIVFGGLLGMLSYFVMPQHFVNRADLRVLLSTLSSISAGLGLCLITWFIWRKHSDEGYWSTTYFVQGLMFGMSYSAARAGVVQ
jgi:hypothetical protein